LEAISSIDDNDNLVIEDASEDDADKSTKRVAMSALREYAAKVSEESGNALESKTDGLFVAPGGVEISSDTGNVLTTKDDGLYVPTVAGNSGKDGQEVELGVDSGYVVWRYANESVWKNLVALSSLKGDDGEDGREVEISTDSGYIVWRYAGVSSWSQIVALSSLKGATGDDGADGKSAYDLSGFDGTEAQWLASLKGATGDDGAAATVAVGSVTTGEPGTSAAVSNSGTSAAAVLDFTIPKGAKGDTGDVGPNAITEDTETDFEAGSVLMSDGHNVTGNLASEFATGSTVAIRDEDGRVLTEPGTGGTHAINYDQFETLAGSVYTKTEIDETKADKIPITGVQYVAIPTPYDIAEDTVLRYDTSKTPSIGGTTFPAGQFLTLTNDFNMFGLFSDDGVRFVLGYAKIAESGTEFEFDEVIYDSANGGWIGVDANGEREVNERIRDIHTGVWESIDGADTTFDGWSWDTDWKLVKTVVLSRLNLSDVDAAKPNRSELTSVLTGVSYAASDTAVTGTYATYNAATKSAGTVTVTFPLASVEKPGAMTSAAYSALQSAVADIQTLQQQGGRFIGVSFATQAALAAYVIPASVHGGDFTYVLDDETENGATTRYICVETTSGDVVTKSWALGYIINYDPVGLATTEAAGLVLSVPDSKGESDGEGGNLPDNRGKVFVEMDGSMSVIGWDAAQAVVDIIKTDGDGTMALLDDGTYGAAGKVNKVNGIGPDESITDPSAEGFRDVKTDYVFATEAEFNAAEANIPKGARVVKTWEFPDNTSALASRPDLWPVATEVNLGGGLYGVALSGVLPDWSATGVLNFNSGFTISGWDTATCRPVSAGGGYQKGDRGWHILGYSRWAADTASNVSAGIDQSGAIYINAHMENRPYNADYANYLVWLTYRKG
jgi:hypothetical protein